VCARERERERELKPEGTSLTIWSWLIDMWLINNKRKRAKGKGNEIQQG